MNVFMVVCALFLLMNVAVGLLRALRAAAATPALRSSTSRMVTGQGRRSR